MDGVPVAEPADAALLQSWAAGDMRAYEALLARYARLVYGRCRRALGAADADDATQAVFLILARRREQAAASPVLAAWLMRVAENVVRNARRDQERRRRAERSIPPPRPAVETAMHGFQDHLDACLAELPAAERDAITLHHLAGLSLAEVAQRSDAGLSTVKDRLNRGLERLRKAFLARGLTLGVPVLLVCLAGEAAAAVPEPVLVHLRDLAPAGGGTGTASVPSERARRWSRERVPIMTRIIIAGSALLLVGGSLTALLSTAEPAAVASPPAPPPPPVKPAQPYLDPEHARSWVVVRWNDGARTAERLRRLPEMALLPDADAWLARVASLRSAALVIGEAGQPPAERVLRYRIKRDLAVLEPGDQVRAMRSEFERLVSMQVAPAGGKPDAQISLGLSADGVRIGADPVSTAASGPWAGVHGWLDFAAADSPGLVDLRGLLATGVPLLGLATRPASGGWTVDAPAGTCRIAIDRNRVICTGMPDPGIPRLLTEAGLPGGSPADLTCSFILDPGLAGSAAAPDGGMQLIVTDDGLRLSATYAWATPQEQRRGAGRARLDLGRLDRVPAAAFLAAGLPMTPAATRDSVLWQSMVMAMERAMSLSAPAEGKEPAVAGFRRVIEAVGRIDGDIVGWIEPGSPLPTITIEADLAPVDADALIAATGRPRAADGSVSWSFGMTSVAVGMRDGRLVCTTDPAGISGMAAGGGFMQQPEIVRAVAAMPSRTPQGCVLLRPAALVAAIGPYAAMAGPEWGRRVGDYEQRLAGAAAFGFLAGWSDAQGSHVDAAGALSLLAAGLIGGKAVDPMTMFKIAN